MAEKPRPTKVPSSKPTINAIIIWNLLKARLPKRLRGSVEVGVVKTAWVRIPYLATIKVLSSPLAKAKKKDFARMAERLRRATQVRVKRFSWVRIPLLALRSVLRSVITSLQV